MLEDPVWEDSGHTLKGRDGCRVPLPWTADGESYGFGTNGSWLPQPANWGDLSVQAQDGVDGSTLELYRRALHLRGELLRAGHGFEWRDVGEAVLAFSRPNGLECWVNLGSEAVELPKCQVLLSSGELTRAELRPDTTVWFRPES